MADSTTPAAVCRTSAAPDGTHRRGPCHQHCSPSAVTVRLHSRTTSGTRGPRNRPSIDVQAHVEVARAVAVRRGAEPEAAVEALRRLVALVHVELDAPALAGTGAVERRRDEGVA